MFDGNIFVFHSLRKLFRLGKRPLKRRGRIEIPRSNVGNARKSVEILRERARKPLGIRAAAAQNAQTKSVRFQKRFRKMLRGKLRIAAPYGAVLRHADRLQRFLRKFPNVHHIALPC